MDQKKFEAKKLLDQKRLIKIHVNLWGVNFFSNLVKNLVWFNIWFDIWFIIGFHIGINIGVNIGLIIGFTRKVFTGYVREARGIFLQGLKELLRVFQESFKEVVILQGVHLNVIKVRSLQEILKI